MKVLFMCVANSARSQIAEALAINIWGPSAEIASAGSQPSGVVNPIAISTMRKMGIDMSNHRSKSWTDLPDGFRKDLDFLITLCAEEECPNIPTSAVRLSWAMPDPANAKLTDSERQIAFQEAAQEIKKKIILFSQTHGLKKS